MTIKLRHIPTALLAVALIYYILLIPALISDSGRWDQVQAMRKFYRIQLYHGACAVRTDFSHAIRCNNGEMFRLKGRG